MLQDDLGIVYVIENAQQFWSELEDMLAFPKGFVPSLTHLDSTLKRFVALCGSHHEQYLPSPLQLEHACQLICDSELFTFHSERMSEILVDDLQSTTNPHTQLIIFHILLTHGRRRTDFLRSQKRWQPLIPLLMDYVLVEMDPQMEEYYISHSAGPSGSRPIPVPIEAKLRDMGVNLLYEVCRVQKLPMSELRIFDDRFLDHLFDLVEQTRDMPDESFNYAVIKLIISLNEQFMVATLAQEGQKNSEGSPNSKNRVLRVLMRRLGSSKTFGENMIFMLNRAGRSPEDLCMQLLVLKILYLLFTTPDLSEYFYTNDLCVLVDVFLRELVNLDEDRESLRHTYLRVLHPLLTRTQLKSVPYKRPQILSTLESLISNSNIRYVNPTTRRLVERCLTGEWCAPLRSTSKPRTSTSRYPSSTSDDGTLLRPTGSSTPQGGSLYSKGISSAAKSMENLTLGRKIGTADRSLGDQQRRSSNSSSSSFTGVASAHAPTSSRRQTPPDLPSEVSQAPPVSSKPPRRSAPPPPKQRRAPPAVPVGLTSSGATITKIK